MELQLVVLDDVRKSVVALAQFQVQVQYSHFINLVVYSSVHFEEIVLPDETLGNE